MTSSEMKKYFKKQQMKSFFAIVKDYKRYYLGSLLWLNAFKILNNKAKMQKWQQKHKERYENLQLAIKKYKWTKNAILQSKIWLNSKEFKEKYLDTKHPYPPLLNPDSVDYEIIPAELAWEWNLPLPPNYEFMYFSNGSTASWATFEFFKNCSVNCATNNDDIFNPKSSFLYHYNFLASKSKQKQIFFSYFGSIMQYEYAEHLVASLTKKCPLFYVARCPIGRLKHLINHQDSDYVWAQRIPQINLTFDYTKLFPNLRYWSGDSIPSFPILNDYSIVFEKLMLDSALDKFDDKISSIYCVEFSDLKADKAFDTFCKLADMLGFDKPTNKEIFTNRINRNRGTLTTLPTTLYAHADDLLKSFKIGQKEKRDLTSLEQKDGFSIIVTLPHYLSEEQKDFVDISEEIYPNPIIDDTKILIIIDKKELSRLKENVELFNVTKIYLKGYIDACIDNVNKVEANLINEEQILEYLKTNKEVRIKIKKILDNELNYIKEHHPNFIEKWKYYLEFEKMCAELDGEKDEK